MTSVAIVGGGITGLSAAWQLAQLSIPFTLYESSGRLGGMAGSVRRDGYLLERGPSALLATSPKVTDLVTALGLNDRIAVPSSVAKRRYIVKQRKLAPLPQPPLDILRTSLLSSAGKLRILAEPFVPARRNSGEESLASFVIRRLGQEVLDYFVNPVVGGVYAGDPERLSVEYAFPKLFHLEQEYGSLIKGALVGARKRSRSSCNRSPRARVAA